MLRYAGGAAAGSLSALAGCVGPLDAAKDRVQDAIGTCPDIEITNSSVTGTSFGTVIVSVSLESHENAEAFVQVWARITVDGETREDYRRVRLLAGESTTTSVDFYLGREDIPDDEIEYEVWLDKYSYLPCD